MHKYQTIIVDLSNGDKFVNPYNKRIGINEDALLWYIYKSTDIYKFEPKILSELNNAFSVVWVYPFELSNQKKIREFYFIQAVSKSNNYFFDKNPIREKSIWKDVEWGKREKNYNPNGKDPGTVWIKIIDDGKAHTIGHEFFTPLEVFDRIKKSSCKNSGDKCLILSNNFTEVNGFDVQSF